jgi:hypothetical protein
VFTSSAPPSPPASPTGSSAGRAPSAWRHANASAMGLKNSMGYYLLSFIDLRTDTRQMYNSYLDEGEA